VANHCSPQFNFSDLDLATIATETTKDRRQIETEADRSNDQRSLDRALEEKLYLLVKTKDQEEWTLPQVELQGDDITLLGVSCTTILT